LEPWPRPPQTSPGSRRSPDSAGAPDTAERRAREILADGDLARLLTAPREGREIERARQIFVNRNLRMSRIELVGFDMDYTLAIYHARRIEQLSFDMTLQRLVSERGYPEEIGGIQYDHGFVMRGLVVDKLNGNLIKMDRFGYVGRAYHGLKPLDPESWRRLYRHESINFKRGERYAQIDTLFALPEAYLYAGTPSTGTTPSSRRSARTSAGSSSGTRSWDRRSTSCGPAARSCSCSPTPSGTTPTR